MSRNQAPGAVDATPPAEVGPDELAAASFGPTSQSFVSRHLVVLVGVFGALFVMQTVLWEYGRMNPSYGFIVEPWSIRGYETVHGWIAFAIGAASLVAVLAVHSPRSADPVRGTLVALGIAVVAVAIAFAPSGGRVEMTPGFAMVALLALVVAYVAHRAFLARFPESRVATTFWMRSLLMIGLIVVGGAMLDTAIGGRRLEVDVWIAIAAVFAMVFAISVAPAPRQLVANRMLMLSALVGGTAIALSAGAVRSTLLRLQMESGDGVATFRDTQVTSGHLMAVIGMVIVFVAAVALWGRRRDSYLNAQRAHRQRAAAEESAAEIRAAERLAGITR